MTYYGDLSAMGRAQAAYDNMEPPEYWEDGECIDTEEEEEEVMGKVYSGTLEELANNDELMVQLSQMDCERTEMWNWDIKTVTEYLCEQVEASARIHDNISAAVNRLARVAL